MKSIVKIIMLNSAAKIAKAITKSLSILVPNLTNQPVAMHSSIVVITMSASISNKSPHQLTNGMP